MIYIVAVVTVGVCVWLYRRWYCKNHISLVIVDYIDGDFHPRPAKTIRFPPKWYKKQSKRWKSEDVPVDVEGP